jgi:hypothetical protein
VSRQDDGLIERDIGTEQNYEAWFDDYPSTHRRAGQTVEVVTREAYERLHDQLRGAVDALRWYADEANWSEIGEHGTVTTDTPIRRDRGQRARAALGGSKGI